MVLLIHLSCLLLFIRVRINFAIWSSFLSHRRSIMRWEPRNRNLCHNWGVRLSSVCDRSSFVFKVWVLFLNICVLILKFGRNVRSWFLWLDLLPFALRNSIFDDYSILNNSSHCAWLTLWLWSASLSFQSLVFNALKFFLLFSLVDYVTNMAEVWIIRFFTVERHAFLSVILCRILLFDHINVVLVIHTSIFLGIFFRNCVDLILHFIISLLLLLFVITYLTIWAQNLSIKHLNLVATITSISIHILNILIHNIITLVMELSSLEWIVLRMMDF